MRRREWARGAGLAVGGLILAFSALPAPLAHPVPSHDVAAYLDQAQQLLHAMKEGDGAALWSLLATPRIHPPGHPLLVAAWWSLFDGGLPGAMDLAYLETALGLGLLVVLGAATGGGAGALTGLAAALVAGSTGELWRLRDAPMSEAPSLLLAHLALLSSWWADRPGRHRAAWLLVGLVVLACGLVRYSQLPLVAAGIALGAAHPLRALRGGRARVRVALLLGPSVAIGLAWGWAEPGLPAALRDFFVNVQPEPAAGVAPDPARLLSTLEEHYFGAFGWVVAALAGLLAAAACALLGEDADPRAAALRGRAALYAGFGLAAVAIHPFALHRLAVPFVPAAVWVGLDALRLLATARGWDRALAAAVPLLLVGWSAHRWAIVRGGEGVGRPEVVDDAATAQALLWNGLVPVFCDCLPGTLTIDPEDVARNLSASTSAICPAYVYGLPPDVDELVSIGKRAGLPVYFDSAQGFASSYRGRPAGGFGVCEVFSMSPTKVITAVEGGLVSTNDERLASLFRSMRDYGKDAERGEDMIHLGLSARMSEMHAAVGLLSLRSTADRVRARSAWIERYRDRLGSLAGCRVQEIPGDRASSGNYFVLFVGAGARTSRDRLQEGLAARGIQTKRYFHPPLHRQTLFRRHPVRLSAKLTETERASAEALALPLFSHMSEGEFEAVCQGVEAMLA